MNTFEQMNKEQGISNKELMVKAGMIVILSFTSAFLVPCSLFICSRGSLFDIQ